MVLLAGLAAGAAFVTVRRLETIRRQPAPSASGLSFDPR
jgi:hypothetical protein